MRSGPLRFKSEFMIHMDGLLATQTESQYVLVLCTTNSPWLLDDALRRRLEKRIMIPLPDEESRAGIIKGFMEGVTLSEDFDEGFIKDTAAKLTKYVEYLSLTLIVSATVELTSGLCAGRPPWPQCDEVWVIWTQMWCQRTRD